MDITHPTHHFVQRASFHLLTPDQVRRLSVKAITQPEIFDTLNHPLKGGLYDPALGPIDKHSRCATCGLGAFQCPGHFGHIELAVPVYAPLTFAQMFQLLRQTCLYCHRFRCGTLKTQLCLMRLQLLEVGLLMEAKELDLIIHQREGLDDETRSTEAVMERLTSHVQELLTRAREDGCRPGRGPKIAAVATYRARVIGDFLKGSNSASNICQHCRGYIPGLYRHGGTKVFLNPLRKNLQVMMDAKGMDTDQLFKPAAVDDEEDHEDLAGRGETAAKGMKFLTPMHVHEHLRLLWKHESVVCQVLFGSQLKKLPSGRVPVDHRIFFSQVLAVPPSRFRPPSVFGRDQFDHPQNTYLKEIIKLNQRIMELRQNMTASPKGGKPLERIDVDKGSATIPSFADLIKTWVALQEQVNFLFDSSKNTSIPGKLPPPGIKQILEKKEGLFRKHMMGKRVNYAARSVISPDPNIETSEIGVPMVFAKRLTYPEPVTEYNVAELRQAVINGPECHPGATHVQMEDGTLANLETMSKSGRVALANQLLAPSTSTLVADSTRSGLSEVAGGLATKRVMRHIRNNDLVLMNRQPTLHKPSIMAHRVRVLPGEKTIRMHYANCNTYNADFDGDEMNMHFPQSELGRAEAASIANTNNQYLVPTDGSPLRGLIQDHVVSGVILTLKDTWVTRETYQQLLWGALPESAGRVLGIPPAIIRPQPLWSGKQIITTVLLNLARGRPAINMSCNCKISAKMWGPSHADEAQVLIVDGYLVTGVMDKSQFGASAYGITHAVYELYGPDAAGSLLTTIGRLLTRFDQYVGFTCRMDDLILDEAANERRVALINQSHALGRQVVAEYAAVDAKDREAVAGAMERILRSDELLKGLDGLMKTKMNELTSRIIEACLPDGQFKPFPLNNMSLMTLSGAKGSMVNFSQIAGLLGQQELEGRRVPTMVSGKTHPAFVAFDPRARAGGYITQRFLTGIRPQEFFFHCMAGREGLIDTAVKTSRSGYLQRCLIKHLESLKVSYDSTVRDGDGSVLQFYYGEDGLDVIRQKYLRNFSFAARNFDIIAQQVQPAVALERVNTEAAVKATRKTAKKPHKYEPVLARFNPNVFLGATSERFAHELEAFLATAEGRTLVPDATQFRAVMWLRYMRALADAGEAVGLLAAQSVGEPSTQMTLNTFHFAGFGAKNVTLGIPRLREIVMMASQKIKTPSITVPLLVHGHDNPHPGVDAEALARKMSKLTLKQLVQDISVEERLLGAAEVGPVAANLGRRARVYSVVLSFLPLKEAEAAFGVHEEEIRTAVENGLVRVLLGAVEKAFKRLRANAAATLISHQAVKKVRAVTISEEGQGETAVAAREAEDSEADSEAEDEPIGEEAGAKKTLRMQATTQENSSDDESVEETDKDGENNSTMDVDTAPIPSPTLSSEPQASKDSVLAQTRIIKNYQFDALNMVVRMDVVFAASQPKLLLLDILERHVQDVVVRQIPGISRVFPHRDDNAPLNSPATGITTEGANLRGLWEHPWASKLLDLRQLLSNDVHAVLTTYGVEAARATIVREVASVFAVYGISVDPRHLSLIADYMTVDGGYRPFNRTGMAAAPSPLLQMTFETTLGFLRQAALMGEWDECESPSARIVVGLPVRLGTGACEIRQPLVLGTPSTSSVEAGI